MSTPQAVTVAHLEQAWLAKRLLGDHDSAWAYFKIVESAGDEVVGTWITLRKKQYHVDW